MLLTPGTRLGAYEIQSALGAGGMGEVYRARDTRLDRVVAIKVMPEHIAATPDLRQRFEREAKTVASLNHPHICTLYDVGRHEDTDFLVLEFLDGETLEQRLRKGPLPLELALEMGTQIAEALAAAHRAGVVHRDLKPGNVMLTNTGAKLLDFGLAKTGAATLAGGLSMLPTTPPFDGTQARPDNLTAQGSILGTLQYMAPEQLEGLEADARTDIFAFGTVLYEMVTGTKAFEGKSQASLIGAILRDTPPAASARQPLAPPALDRLIATCLAKAPADRWQAAHDLTLQLRWVGEAGVAASATVPGASRPGRREMLAWVAAVIGLVVSLAVLGSRYFEPAEPELGPVRFVIDMPASSGFNPSVTFLSVSPDGRRVVFEMLSQVSRSRSLWVRSLDSTDAQPLSGTEGATQPFWSPDSSAIGFFADGKLKTISVSGGPPRTLCDAPTGGGGTWGRDGVILFALQRSDSIYRVPESGGVPVAATTLDRTPGAVTHGRPHFLPDGRHFLFYAAGSDANRSGIYVGTIDSAETRLLESDVSQGAYAPPGYVLFARSGTLMARPFDLSRQEAAGDAVPLAEVRQGTGLNRAAVFSVSASGVLVYQPPGIAESQLVWLTRDGKVTSRFAARGPIHAFWLAPDQERAVVEQASDLWLLDSTRGTASRFTTDDGLEAHPIWSHDGRRIAFSISTQGRARLALKVTTGVSEAELFVDTPTSKWVSDWSSDGRTLVFEEQNRDTGWDISVVPVDGDRTPRPVIRSRFDERMGSLSPDGRHLAYTSNETGRAEVYVVTFPDVTDKWTISTDGGTAPRWRQDGDELFFVDTEGVLMSVPVTRGVKFAAGVPKPLFELEAVQTDGWTYAVSADGQRILVARPTETAPNPITVVVNWPALLNR